MGLKSLMARLQSWVPGAADTPDTPEINMGYQRKAPIHAGCTPDTPNTPRFVDTRATVQAGQVQQAGNDLASAYPAVVENLTKLNLAAAANNPAQAVVLLADSSVSKALSSEISVSTEPPHTPIDPDAWRVLAQAYYAHHFKCPICIVAGRGTGYGFRCGTGAALWIAHDSTV